MRPAVIALLALLATSRALASCVVTDSAGLAVSSGTSLSWQRFCVAPYAVVRPGAAESGRLAARSTQWLQDFVNRSKPGEKVVYPACGSEKADGVVYLVPPPANIDGWTCELRGGTTLLVPAYTIMSIGGECGPQMRQADEELPKHQEHFAVAIDGKPLAKGAFWRNESRACFAFESPLTGMSVQVGNAEAKQLAEGYTDGYWTMLRFDEPGSYVLRITQPPHKKWQWDDTFTMDGSYTIRVRR
jgi:hypothetical protein